MYKFLYEFSFNCALWKVPNLVSAIAFYSWCNFKVSILSFFNNIDVNYLENVAIEILVVGSNFGDLPIGAACVADFQYKGRGFWVFYFFAAVFWILRCNCVVIIIVIIFAGRSKNVWESPKGCLLFSFTIHMEDGRVVPLVQYVVSLAMTEAIKDVCDRNVSVFYTLLCLNFEIGLNIH